MTRSLNEADLPELAGLDQFRHAVDPRGVLELLHIPMADMVLEFCPTTVLDYGCGQGELAELLVHKGASVSGYDPDPGVVARCLHAEVLWNTVAPPCWSSFGQIANSSTR